ncbi:glycosyltransferase BC10-like isoform X1 [Nicotiana tabacum]|uniref:Glycosyltransferase BC10-like isoform X1 n=1 Tax=Nicotiana tabacum TaxID=4097 RepID=A0AC58TII5_TOBAC
MYIAMFVRELYIYIKREVKEMRFQIITTIVFTLSMAFFVLLLGMFINDQFKKIVIYEDFYFPHQLTTLSSPIYNLSVVSTHLVCNSSSNSSTSISSMELKDWLSPKDLWHAMNDEELMWRASMVSQIMEYPFNRTPKVAFLFLTRGRLPLAPLWEMFFKGHEELFSIYLHTSPEFNFEPPPTSVFYKRRIPSQEVQWGRASMIDAERRLLANALLDISNERFILLSETCIPLFNFTTIYTFLTKSNQSFLGLFDDLRKIGRGRYNKRMYPIITISDWRKGSQWFEVHRELALKIISDVTYYPVFKNYCTPPCYMDEHYLPTLVNKVCPKLTSNWSVTWADWSAGGSHPTTFLRKDVTEEFLDSVRYGSNCSYNGELSSISFLFGRKFHPSTLQPLLRIGPKLFGFG